MFPAKIYLGQIAVVLGIVVSTWGATQLDQPFSIERGKLHATERSLERRHYSSFGPAWGLSNFMHVFIVQVDQIAKRANVPRHAWLARSVAIDIALHLERPFFAVLTPSECFGHIAGLPADLDAPVP